MSQKCQSPGMRVLVILLVVAGCKSSSQTSSPPAGDYCRGQALRAPGATPTLGTQTGSEVRPAHTFSIVARDPVTGDLGVAVQSHYFGVGSVVVWAEAGVGAVATQSFVEPAYGPRGLGLMRDGIAAPDAMAQLVAADKQASVRQLGFIDARGRVASHTGAKCIGVAASHVGTGYAVQANIMANDRVVPAMAAAYEAAKGDLADRMLAALDAAQAAGGDLRGCQSAAILVVSGTRSDTPWKEKKLDLRVEDSADPLRELRRLVVLGRAYDQENQGDLAVEKHDIDAAVEHYGNATRIAPDNIEMVYWSAVSLAGAGRVDQAIPMFKRAFSADRAWQELTRRLVTAGLLPQPAADRVLKDAR
ncbi:MAG TPA: DUF1028 domain-containing protein [Kofleriaceae bacterium]|nr:DUF1028 domain-containing protein [Kofleriaceae bacterium]